MQYVQYEGFILYVRTIDNSAFKYKRMSLRNLLDYLDYFAPSDPLDHLD